MSKVIRRFIDYKYPIGAVAIGYVLILIGLVSCFITKSILLSGLLILLGSYLAFSHFGILLDIEKRKFKYYKSQFGIKEGVWKNFKNYPYLTLLTINQKQTVYSFTSAQNTSRFVIYRICILSQKHTEKIIVKEFYNKLAAENYIEKLSKELSLEKVIYSPDFS